MKCTVTFRHLKPSDPIREYVEEKVEKIGKFIEANSEAKVVLSVERRLHSAHIELVTHGSLRLRGIEKSEDMYASIDLAVEKILRQVKRYRSKIKSHREASQSGGRVLPHQVLHVAERRHEVDEDTAEIPRIVRQETMVAQEMLVDDAVMRLDLMNAEFLVFTNASSHRVNVVYRMPDGQYGLIEAHAA